MTSRSKQDAAIAALRGRRTLRSLARIASRRGVTAWIVGGAVRDSLLGLETPEIDVAVSADAEGMALALEHAGHGRSVFLSRGRPGPRVFRVAGSLPVDLAELEGPSIEADLARRDFTANAIAIELPTGRIVDPFGGRTDLAKRRLRCIRERNLLEDPLRALRAARFIATHGLVPDAATLAAARRAADRLPEVAPERIGAELAKLLGSPRASPALSWAARAHILSVALGLELSDARSRRVARALAAADDRGIRRLPASRRRRLRLAFVAARVMSRGVDARLWLRRRRSGRRDAEEVARLAELAGSVRKIRSREDRWRWLFEADGLAEDALLLAARLHPRSRPLARRLERLRKTPRGSVRVKGGDIVRWLGIPPGPAVGEWLSEIAIAAAMGKVRNRRQARIWLTGQVRKGPSPAIISAH